MTDTMEVEAFVEEVMRDLSVIHLEDQLLNYPPEEVVRGELKKARCSEHDFSLQQMITGNVLWKSIVEQSKMDYMLLKIYSFHEVLSRTDGSDDYAWVDWEEPLLCEWASLLDHVDAPIQQTRLVDSLVQLFINRRVKISFIGDDVMLYKWSLL